MKKTEKSFYNIDVAIVDGNYFGFRAYSKLNHLRNRKGENTGVVFGFLKELLYVYKNIRWNKLVVVWDGGGTRKRRALLPEYKRNRKRGSIDFKDYTRQLNILQNLLSNLGVVQYKGEDTEADDLVAGFVLNTQNSCCILSSDSDYYQLISENVCVYKPTTEVVYDLERFNKEFALNPSQYLDLKILVGDSSDNIPGVPGVGEVSARKFINKHNSLRDFFEVGLCEDKLDNIVRSNKEIVVRNFMLMDLNNWKFWVEGDLIDFCITGELNKAEVDRCFLQLEFYSLRKQQSFEELLKMVGGEKTTQ